MAGDRNTNITNYNPVDQHVGGRLRLRRTMLGMTQSQLASRLELTFQQVQKYERGANRISASRLWDLSQILQVEVSYFFEEMAIGAQDASPRKLTKSSVKIPVPPWERDPMARRETLELVRSYYLIKEPQLRKKMAQMIKSVASSLDHAIEKKE